MEEQGPFDRVLQSEPLKRRDSAAVAIVALAIVLGVILLVLVLPPVSILDDDEPLTADYQLRDELPRSPEGYEAVSRFFDRSTFSTGNSPARITVPLTTQVLESEVLSLFTYRSDRWVRLGDATPTEGGRSAKSGDLAALPDNVAVMRTVEQTRTVAGILPAGAELDPDAASNLSVLHPTGLSPVSDGTVAGDRPSFGDLQLAVVPLIGAPDAQVVDDVLSSPDARAAHVRAIRDLVRDGNYAGIDIDYRAMNAARGVDFTSFANELSSALHEDQKSLTLTLPLPAQTNETWDTFGFDWQALGSAADTIEIGQVEPDVYHQRMEAALGYIASRVSSGKLFLPLSTLSRDRGPDGTGTPPLAEALGLAASPVLESEGSIAPGATVQVTAQNLSDQTGGSRLRWDDGFKAVVFTYTGRGGQHTVWLANRFSEAARLELAQRHQAGGAVIEDVSARAADAGIWPVVAQYATAGEVSLSTPNGTLLEPHWSTSGGSLPSDAGAQVDWTAPDDAGTQTITLIVSDGVLRIGRELQVQVAAATP